MEISAVNRDEYSAGFFEGTAKGQLLVRRCENHHYVAYTRGYGGPALCCHVCQSERISWQPASGRATLVSWVVIHSRDGKADDRIPGIVELAEGPWLHALIDVPSDDDLHVGQLLTVGFLPTDGGEVIPAFQPVEG